MITFYKGAKNLEAAQLLKCNKSSKTLSWVFQKWDGHWEEGQINRCKEYEWKKVENLVRGVQQGSQGSHLVAGKVLRNRSLSKAVTDNWSFFCMGFKRESKAAKWSINLAMICGHKLNEGADRNDKFACYNQHDALQQRNTPGQSRTCRSARFIPCHLPTQLAPRTSPWSL